MSLYQTQLRQHTYLMRQTQERERYSWSEYLSWPDWERYELIDGVPHAMSPAPRRKHQEIVGEFHRQMANALRGHGCRVFPSLFDVKLSDDRHDHAPTVVQPDITVNYDPSKLTEQGMTGAPDPVVELVSPDRGLIDRGRRFELYRRYGVREYWIVDHDERLAEVYLLDNGEYRREAVCGPQDSLHSRAVAELTVDLTEVFPEPPAEPSKPPPSAHAQSQAE